MRYIILLLSLGLSFSLVAQTTLHAISKFASTPLTSWKKQLFHNETEYRIETTPTAAILRAHSQSSASGLLRKGVVDLQKTPYLYWSWKVEQGLSGLDERTKAGDDYAAKIYVIVSDGPFFWQTRSLAYVWSSSEKQGQFWPNAYAKDNLVMVAVADQQTPLQQWQSQRRDVRADLRRYLGKDYRQIEAIALMTDADNSKQEAIAYYGEIYFSSD